jgi:hypothetical protein
MNVPPNFALYEAGIRLIDFPGEAVFGGGQGLKSRSGIRCCTNDPLP